MIIEKEDFTIKARAFLDDAILQISGRTLVSTAEMIDILLDARNSLETLAKEQNEL